MIYAMACILLALIQYQLFGMRAGGARVKYGVNAPKVSGNETWERLFRVHQNTMEQLIIYIPAMFIFAHYMDSIWVLLPGLGFIIGRQLYSYQYVNDPASRLPGMAITFLSNAGLILGSGYFVVCDLLK